MEPEDFKLIKQEITEIEQALGTQEGFFTSLIKSETDWSFIIKLHAFFEAVCTVVILKALGKNELIDVISRANIRVKTQYIEKLSLLGKEAVEFIRGLSNLRNTYVHNIKNVSLDLETYLKQLDKAKRNDFVEKLGYSIAEEIKIRKITVKKKDFILENPRLAIHLGAFSVLSELAAQLVMDKLRLREVDIEKKEAEFHKRIAEFFLAYLTPVRPVIAPH
jgi:hypothetical protein